jgi:hypothetical protein
VIEAAQVAADAFVVGNDAWNTCSDYSVETQEACQTVRPPHPGCMCILTCPLHWPTAPFPPAATTVTNRRPTRAAEPAGRGQAAAAAPGAQLHRGHGRRHSASGHSDAASRHRKHRRPAADTGDTDCRPPCPCLPACLAPHGSWICGFPAARLPAHPPTHPLQPPTHTVKPSR